MHKNMPATTWQTWVHVFNFFTCLLDRGGSKSTFLAYSLISSSHLEASSKSCVTIMTILPFLDNL